MKNWINLAYTFEKVIDYRGKTPKKLGKEWTKSGYKALSALNIKTTGISNISDIKYGDEELYNLWMKDEVKRGDILLTSEAPAGQIMVWDSDEKIILSQRLFALRINKINFDNYFIKYYLQSETGQKEIFKNTSGSTVFGISAKMFELIKVPNIEFITQQRIGKILKSLDDKIELNNRINAELEAMAKTLYDYWFVQFDFPIVTSSGVEKPYKSSGGKMVYNETLKREIPEGWEVKKLEEIVKKISNSINPNDFQDLKYLPIDKLPKKSFSYSDFEDRENANSSLIKFDKDDILLGAMRVYFHRVCLAYEDGISRNTIFVLRPKHKFLRLFSLFLINKEETIQFANDNSTGSSIPYAKWENGLADYQFCLPSENLIVKFEKQISPIMDKIINNSKQNQELSALRDWLLPMLMNGQVKVG